MSAAARLAPCCLCAAVLLAPGLLQAQPAEPSSFGEFLAAGSASLAFTYRYEFVDQEGFDENANASTLKLRLTYDTPTWQGWSGRLELDDVLDVVLQDFNSGAGTSGPNRNRFPVVADPDGPDLNQLYVAFSPSEDLRARIGRQRINLDDQRFVGGVGWRQNEQTYDGLSLRYDGWENTSLFYAYVANVARIFGSEVPAGSHEQDTHLLHLRVDLHRDLAVTGYGYRIDNEDAPAFSTDTFGLRIEGAVEIGKSRVSLLGEVAVQNDAGNNPASFDANYHRLQGLWHYAGFTAGAGLEVLGSDNGQGFRTPLATLHAFNGWADVFLATPSAGLEDWYLRFGKELSSWTLDARYHEFSAEASGGRFGHEIDLQATRDLGDRFDLLLKAAFFDGTEPAFGDTTKIWLMVSAAF